MIAYERRISTGSMSVPARQWHPVLWLLVATLLLAAPSHPETRATAGLQTALDRTVQDETILVSRASGANGAKGDGGSTRPSISATGRYIAFSSGAATLHPDDTDSTPDVFVRDLQTQDTILISRATGADGAKGNGNSSLSLCACPSVSADDRFVVFGSLATNLHLDDTDDAQDVFVRDLQTNETILVSRASGTDGVKGNGTSSEASVSADGRYVAFDSRATNLHPDDTDGFRDVFVRDLQTHETILVSRASGPDGAKGNGDSLGPSISAGGRYVAFASVGSNLHPDDTDDFFAVFVRDLQTHETILVSRASGPDGVGANNLAANPKITPDGRFVAFDTNASNIHPDATDAIADAFVRDMQTHETILVSRTSGPDGVEGDNASGNTSISADGRYVAFNSWASNLHPEDDEFADVFMRDLQTHETLLISRASGSDGVKGDDESSLPSISGDGRYVAFRSFATNLHPDDIDDILDVFVRDVQGPPDFTITPNPLDFGAVPVGATAGPLSVTLINSGTESLTISELSDPEAPFEAVGGTCDAPPFTLAPEESCSLDYTFGPTALGPDATTVTVTSDASGSPHTVNLRGNGVSSLSITPDPLEFGDVLVGETGGPRSLTLANIGTTDVTVNDVLAPAIPFAAAGGSCSVPPFVLAPEATCTLDYTFSPTAEGPATGTVTVASDAPGSPDTLTLRGTGLPVPPPLVDVDPDNLSTVLMQGQVETQPLTIANLGVETLEWEVTDEGDGSGRILRPAGRATALESHLPPPVVEGLAAAAETQGVDAELSHPFTPLATATTITHSTSLDILGGNTVVCEGPEGTTAKNQFLRTFTLTDFGITSPFDVTEVTFGVETLTATTSITVNLYTLEGAFTYANLTTIGTTTEELAPQDLTLVTVPVTGTAPAGSTLVMEIVAPDLAGVGAFFPGSNDSGETGPSYIAASSCGLTNPFPYAVIGFPNVHLVMTVTGEVDCALPDWVDAVPLSGSVPGGGDQVVDVTFDATDLEPGEFSANLCLATNDPVKKLVAVPLSLTVESPAPMIDVDPDNLSSTLPPGQMEIQPLTVSNLGDETLEWNVTEEGETTGRILWPTERTTTPPTRHAAAATRGLARETGTEGVDTVVSYPFVSPGTETTITHSESLDILGGNTIACIPNGTTTPASQFLRTFTLTDFEITGPFDVTEVTFGVEALNGTAPITVNLYTLEGELVYANLTPIGAATVELTPQNLTLVTVPVTGEAPAGATLVVEIEAPDLSGVAAFFPGSNNLGETAPSYVAANACDAPEPTPYADIGFPNVHLVMTVTGTTEPLVCTLPEWVSVDPLSGSVPAGGDQVVDFTFDTTGLEPGDFSANLCISSNDPTQPLTTVPLSLTVTAGIAELTFDPASIDFGEVEVGSTSLPQTTMLQNTGGADTTGLTFDPPGSGFEADISACDDTLSAGASCPVSVTFSPGEPGEAGATLQVGSNEGASAAAELSGNGVGDGGFTAMALQVDHGELVSDGNGVFEPGERVVVTPSWHNDGTLAQSLAGTATDFTGPEGPDYSVLVADADYGEIEPGATASCQETGLCYEMEIGPEGAERPAPHWDAQFTETLSDAEETTQPWRLHVGASFADVPTTSLFYPSIETLLHSGVTGGCGSGEAYCPNDANSRSQMPVFMLRALMGPDHTPPACVEGNERFHDVPFDGVFCPWIQDLANRGIVSGCGGDNYCPSDPVSRAQMAIFILRTLNGEGYEPPECTSQFTDVPCPSLFADWIEDLAAREITGGCTATTYCPGDPVSRAQMAVFITRAFGFTLYGP